MTLSQQLCGVRPPALPAVNRERLMRSQHKSAGIAKKQRPAAVLISSCADFPALMPAGAAAVARAAVGQQAQNMLPQQREQERERQRREAEQVKQAKTELKRAQMEEKGRQKERKQRQKEQRKKTATYVSRAGCFSSCIQRPTCICGRARFPPDYQRVGPGLPDEEHIPHQVAEAFELNEVCASVCLRGTSKPSCLCVSLYRVKLKLSLACLRVRSFLLCAAEAWTGADSAHAQAAHAIEPGQADPQRHRNLWQIREIPASERGARLKPRVSNNDRVRPGL